MRQIGWALGFAPTRAGRLVWFSAPDRTYSGDDAPWCSPQRSRWVRIAFPTGGGSSWVGDWRKRLGLPDGAYEADRSADAQRWTRVAAEVSGRWT